MKTKRIVFFIVLIMAICGERLMADAKNEKWNLNLESGWILPGYNTVQIPRDTGTRFSLKNDLNLPGKLYYRLRISWQFLRRHSFSALFAPLSLTADGRLPVPVDFADKHFAGGDEVTATYRFNSYRLTYRYRLIQKARFKLDIGFTAKIRDAEISVRDQSQEASKTDLGFVPLIHLNVQWKWTDRWGLKFEGDALASPGGQGRAEDLALQLNYSLSPEWRFFAGYRFVEGGADVASVYNFAWIGYVSAGFEFAF